MRTLVLLLVMSLLGLVSGSELDADQDLGVTDEMANFVDDLKQRLKNELEADQDLGVTDEMVNFADDLKQRLKNDLEADQDLGVTDEMVNFADDLKQRLKNELDADQDLGVTDEMVNLADDLKQRLKNELEAKPNVDVSDEMTTFVEALKLLLKNGIPLFQFRSLDPLVLGMVHRKIPQSFGTVELTFKDINVAGLIDSCKVKVNSVIEGDTLKSELSLNFGSVSGGGKFELVLVMATIGATKNLDGDMSVFVKDLAVNMKIIMEFADEKLKIMEPTVTHVTKSEAKIKIHATHPEEGTMESDFDDIEDEIKNMLKIFMSRYVEQNIDALNEDLQRYKVSQLLDILEGINLPGLPTIRSRFGNHSSAETKGRTQDRNSEDGNNVILNAIANGNNNDGNTVDKKVDAIVGNNDGTGEDQAEVTKENAPENPANTPE